MHALLASLGTDGDVFPFIGLGLRLQARGHRVSLAANEQYRTMAEGYGFGFGMLASQAEMDCLLSDPKVWHPVQSARAGARWGRRAFAAQYAVLERMAQAPDTMLIAYPPVFAARLVQEKLGCPLTSLVAMPWFLLSHYEPPALPMAARYPFLQRRLAARSAWRLAEFVTDLLLGGRLNALRAQLGLPRLRRLYRWSFSPQLTVGLFPDWYALPQPDWPRNTRTAGFGLHDGPSALPRELLEFCRAGKAPVAFTFGTGNRHAREQFRAAVDCCRLLGLRAIFLTQYRELLPETLPPTIAHGRYASFSRLFPECAAVVHHGGAGTTAQALAAGLPQLILPMAWDQPDNAFRIQRLGAGLWRQPRCIGFQIAAALETVLAEPVRGRCRKLAANFGREDAYERAAPWIEELAATRGVARSS